MVGFILAQMSFLGYFLLLYVLLQGRKSALYPAILVSAITTVGFCAGMVGGLAHCFSFLYVGGFGLIPLCGIRLFLRRDENRMPSLHSIIPIVCFFAGSTILYFHLAGRFLNRYDDFTHWARIARLLSQELRFPVGTDMISFSSYPPGSGIFIAYISYIVGESENIWMFAQAVMLLSLWLPLLSASRKTGMQLLIVVLMFPLMNYSIPLESLHVDSLLAASAFASLVIMLKGLKDSDRYWLPFVLSLCTLVLIKNSGLFLALIIAAYCVYRYRKERHSYSWKLLMLAIPFIVIMLWNVYVDNHVALESKHQISTKYYQTVLAGKTGADILNIFKIILSIMVNPLRNQALLLIPGYLLILYVYYRQGTLAEKKHVLWFVLTIFIAYEVGIIAMYILSMPMEEFLIQNGSDYDRYNGTITVFLMAFLLYCAGSIRFTSRQQVSAGSIFLQTGAICCIFALFCYAASLQAAKVSTMSYRITKSQTPYRFSLLQEEIQSIPDGSACIVLFDAEDRFVGYNENVAMYYLRTEDIVCCDDEQTALQKRASMPWRYYIDLGKGRIETPVETVGIRLVTRTNSVAFVNVLDECGYMENTRYSLTSAGDITAYDWEITGYIPARKGDVIRLKNITWYPTNENQGRGGVCWFTADKQFNGIAKFAPDEELTNWNLLFDDSGNITQFTVPSGVGSSTAYFRIVCQDINSASIITVNEEIQ